MDHGLEARELRLRKSKAEGGTITLEAYPTGDELCLVYYDDGQGLNLDRIKKKAIEKGLMSASAAPRPEEVAEQILKQGFSTAESTSMVSGRGVGMDAVKSFVEEAGGRLRMEIGSPSHDSDQVTFRIIMTIPKLCFALRSRANPDLERLSA